MKVLQTRLADVSSRTPYPVPAPSAQPPYSYAPLAPPQTEQPVFDPSLANWEQKRRRSSRRAFLIGCIGGAIGLVAVGSIATDVLLHVTQPTLNPLKQALSNIQHTGSIQNSVQPSPVLTYAHHTALVWIVRWSPDGKYIASGSQDGTMLVWRADTGETTLSVRSTMQPAQSDDYPWSIAWSSRRDQKVAVSFVDGTIQVLDASSGQRFSSLNAPASAVAMLMWSPDERHLAVGGSDSIVPLEAITRWRRSGVSDSDSPFYSSHQP